jgi:DNA ligase-1
MLAQKWDSKLDPTGWWMSEKLDGVRGYWDGKNFYSRLGNQFPAPEWFKQGLPKVPLDGELWCGRRQFRRCLSIVRNRGSGDLWEYITYLVFDAPAMKEPYEKRVEFIKKMVVPIDKPDRSSASSATANGSHGTPYAAPVGIVACEGREHLQLELKKVDAKGGEGLMLREPRSAYENKRSRVLRKVKSTHDEEAKVVGHEGGRGKAFRLGALTLQTPDGRQFSCGTGLSAEDRKHPPEIGSIVTFRYTELMDNGYPRFPVYVGPRIDVCWEELCAKYIAPSASSHAPGGLRRDHSIMFADQGLARKLTMKVESLPAPTAVEAAEPWASEGSEGGATEAEGSDDGMSPRARESIPGRSEGGATASTEISRSRSQCFADEAGLDLAVARHILREHDKV